MFVDFGALPPEINSGRMYIGAGAGPLLAAAAAWDELAAALESTAASYRSTVESLTAGPWTGPSSMTMSAAAMPYVAWINETGAQAELAGAQAKLAAAAYETAFAATVPPPVIAANRALLTTLLATNFLGQNTPAIMATEAEYMEMWAQDAAAMYAYAGSSASASQLTSFTDPPQTTNTAATTRQAVAVSQAASTSGSEASTKLSQLVNSVPTLLQNLGSTAGSAGQPSGAAGLMTDLTNWNTLMSTIASGPYSLQGITSIPGGPFLSFGQMYAYVQNAQGLQAYLTPPKAITGALAPLATELSPPTASAGLTSAPVSGTMGRAALVGSLSVPQGWTQAVPEIRTLATVLPTNLASAAEAAQLGEGGVFGEMALASLAGRAVGASAFGSGGGAAVGSLSAAVEAVPAAAMIFVIPALED